MKKLIVFFSLFSLSLVLFAIAVETKKPDPQVPVLDAKQAVLQLNTNHLNYLIVNRQIYATTDGTNITFKLIPKPRGDLVRDLNKAAVVNEKAASAAATAK
jgi:hypothetical protein